MSQSNDSFNPFDPSGAFKNMRDASMDAWAKMMIQLVNTEAYARANGAMLDAWLANSAPFRKVSETIMAQTLANLNLPSRDEITRLAERMTNIEMRLDSLDAKLDECLRPPSKPKRGRKKTASNEDSKDDGR